QRPRHRARQQAMVVAGSSLDRHATPKEAGLPKFKVSAWAAYVLRVHSTNSLALGAGETDAAKAHVAPPPYSRTFLRNHFRLSLASTARARWPISRISPIPAM